MNWLRRLFRMTRQVRRQAGICACLNELPPIGEFEVKRRCTIGVDLGWSLRPEVFEDSEIYCKRCDLTFWRRGFYNPYDKTTPRDEKGWPLNPDGTRMKMVERP